MNETIKLILSLSISGSILAGLVFSMKPLIKHRLSKSIQYFIWIVVLLRFMLPFSFEGSIMNNVFYEERNSAEIYSQSEENKAAFSVDNTINSPALPNVNANAAGGVYNGDADHSRYFRDLFSQYLLYVWLLGVIIALTVNLTGYLKFIKHLKAANKPASDEESKILISLLGGHHNVRLARNPFTSTPMLVGILKPLIVIPDANFNEKQLKNILLHELMHLKHFDIGIKWLSMIATSIHWFNPLMYFIKKEINHACELACDERVIKNLNAAEKQSYGDTLISLASENRYPIGVLQVTMSEEKQTLKERLVSIMKYSKKSKMAIIISGILLLSVIFTSLYLGAGVSIGWKTPPQIYISTENEITKSAIIGTYDWRNLSTHVHADSDHPTNFKYKPDNTVSIAPKEQLIIGTQRLKSDKKYDFTLEQVSVYKDGQPVEFQSPDPSFMNGSLYLQAPPDAGEYIYSLVLNFKNKGTVSYGFAVRVGMVTYNLTDISKYKTPYIGNHAKVSAIVGRLPAPDNYFKQQYISMITSSKPYKLNVFYEAKTDAPYTGKWPIVATDNGVYSNLQGNALVLFCMVDNLDEVTFSLRNSQSNGELDSSKYDTAFTFSRSSIEEKYGSLSALRENLDLLQDALEGKVSAFKGMELYAWKNRELTGNDNIYYTLLIGTNRNKTKSEVYDLNNATTDLNIIKQELSKFSSGTYLFISHSMDIDKETMTRVADTLSSVIKNGSISIGGRELNQELINE